MSQKNQSSTDYQLGVEQAGAVYGHVLGESVNENEKLRKLAQDMYCYAFNREMELCNACTDANGEFADCGACDEYDGACGIAKKRFEVLYGDRMRELGIEVDE